MNSDQEYLYLDVKFNPSCTEVTMKIGVFMYTDKFGLSGGSLEGEEAFKFLKSTIHGKQPDLINYFWMFGPDAEYANLGIKLTVVIPSIKDVKFKHNKFDRKRRAFRTSMMSIPCVKMIKRSITKSDILKVLNNLRSKTTRLEEKDEELLKKLGDIEQNIVTDELSQKIISQTTQQKMDDMFDSIMDYLEK